MSFTNFNLIKLTPNCIIQNEAVENRLEHHVFDRRIPTFQLLALILMCVIIAQMIKPIIGLLPK